MRTSLRHGREEPEFPEGLKDIKKKSATSFPRHSSPNENTSERESITPDKNSSSTQFLSEQTQTKELPESRADQDWENYPNVSDDSEPLCKTATAEEKENHLSDIKDYTEGIIRYYLKLNLEGGSVVGLHNSISPADHKFVGQRDTDVMLHLR